jgi:hypothetical protein
VHVAVEPDLPAQSVETVPSWHCALCRHLTGLRDIRSTSWQVSVILCPPVWQCLQLEGWHVKDTEGTGWCCTNSSSQAWLLSATHLFWSDCTWLMRKERQTDAHQHSRSIAVRSARLLICRLYLNANFSRANTPTSDLFSWSGLALPGQPSHILSTF